MNIFVVIIILVILVIAISCFYLSSQKPSKEGFSTFESYKAIGEPRTIMAKETIHAIGEGRSDTNWFLPLMPGGISSSLVINDFYSSIVATGNLGQQSINWNTSKDILGDMYPLTVLDVNPYTSAPSNPAHVLNDISFMSPKPVNIGNFKIEISKASPISYYKKRKDLTTLQLLYRLYSVRDSQGCGPGGDYIIMTPSVSPNNIRFGKNGGKYGTSPSWSNLHGVTGSGLPSESYFKLSTGMVLMTPTVVSPMGEQIPGAGPTTAVVSQTFDVVDPSTIMINTLLPNYLPDGVVNSSVLEDKIKYFETYYRNKLGCIMQKKFNSLSGSVGYVYNPSGDLVHVEPIRAFQIDRNYPSRILSLNEYPEFEEYYKKFKEEFDATQDLAKREELKRQYDEAHYKVLLKFPTKNLASNTEVALLNHTLPVIPLDVKIIPGYVRVGEVAQPMIEDIIGNVRSVNYITGAEAKNLPIGGVEFFSRDVIDKTFKDFTNRSFTIDAKSISFGVTTPLLFNYNHNYYFPWIGDKRVKTIVIENCNSASTYFYVLGFAIRAYKSDAMDPSDGVVEVPASSISVVYDDIFKNPNRIVDPSIPLPDGNPSNLRMDQKIYPDSLDLTTTEHSSTRSSTIILTLKNPVYIHSITTIFKAHQDLRSGCNVSMYNEYTHAVATMVVNDSYGVGEYGGYTTINGVHSTFGPTTMLESEDVLP